MRKIRVTGIPCLNSKNTSRPGAAVRSKSGCITRSRKTALRNNMIVQIASMVLFTLYCNNALAQSGEDGIQNAITEVSSYFTLGTRLMYAIGSVMGLVGAVKVYNKWNSGDQDTSKVAAAWFSACIFLIVVAAILDGFFIP